MKILTFNIRTAGRDLNPFKKGWWFKRALGTVKMIKAENPDIFCFNEVTPLQQLVFFFIKNYRCKGWYTQNPVFYRKDYKVTEKHISLFKYRSKYLRSYTALALSSPSGNLFNVIGTHLDWRGMLRNCYDTHDCQKYELCNIIDRMPHFQTFICGDFNVENESFEGFTSTKPNTDTFISGGKIDYIINNLNIEECKVLTQYKELSDHYPLIIEYN